MRTLFLVTILLLPLTPSLAQDPGSPAPTASQSAQPQSGSTARSKTTGQKDRVLERTGPGIDWDHRKPGRDWKYTPGRDNGEAGRN